MKANWKSESLVTNESVALNDASITVKSNIGMEKRDVIIQPPCNGVAVLAAKVPTAAIPTHPTRTTRYANDKLFPN